MTRRLATILALLAIALHVLNLPAQAILDALPDMAASTGLGTRVLGGAFWGAFSALPFAIVLAFLWCRPIAWSALFAVVGALSVDVFVLAIVNSAAARGDGQAGLGYIFAPGISVLLVIALCLAGAWWSSRPGAPPTDA